MRKILNSSPLIEIEYISIVDAETLEAIDRISGRVLVALAVRIGSTRLIDNILLDVGKK
jgi:pantoate--beta-alanine ligase